MTSRRKAVLWLIPVVLGILWAGTILTPKPMDFTLGNPTDPAERQKMIGNLKQDLVAIDPASLTSDSYYADPDLNYPLDTLRIVLAIEQFLLENSIIPTNLQLQQTYPDIPPVVGGLHAYRIESQTGDAATWRLQITIRGRTQTLAQGN